MQVETLGAPGRIRSTGSREDADDLSHGQGPIDRQQDSRKRWMGISVANMKRPIEGAPEDARTMITRAMRGSPAHAAGLKRGDCILAAAGKPVLRYQDYLDVARSLEIGDPLTLDLVRNGGRFSATLTLVEKPKSLNGWRRKNFPATPAFDFDLPSLRPQNGRHTAAQGRHQLLYFWATWCGPCRQTSPQVERLHQEAGDRLQVVAVSNEDAKTLRAFVPRSSYTYPVAHDRRGELKLDYEVTKLPTAVLIDPRGTVLAWDYGLGGVQRVLQLARSELGP